MLFIQNSLLTLLVQRIMLIQLHFQGIDVVRHNKSSSLISLHQTEEQLGR